MKVEANITEAEALVESAYYCIEKKTCTMCKKEYKKHLYICAYSFGGSCIQCKKKYLNAINEIKKNGLKSYDK